MDSVISRIQWTNQWDFLLSCLGYAVGVGNVWRFPYFCYRNGGGAFLIPYTFMLAVCALPMFYLEIILGQYHGKSPNIVYKNIASAFVGIGYAMIVVTMFVSIYYNMVLAWTLFYLFASFTSHLPWDSCGNEWNTEKCFNLEQTEECEEQNMTFWDKSCIDIEYFCVGYGGHAVNETFCNVGNGTLISSHDPLNRITPSEEYYLHYMLEITSGLEEMGGIKWDIAFYLLVSWIIVASCLIKGVKSSGKVVYFTAIFPYFVLFILFIRGITLEGAIEGIKFYIIPKWHKLKTSQAWADAASQIFYSLGPGFGNLITLSSYCRFNNNSYRDTLFVVITNCLTSVFAGFIIFSIVGFMARSLNLPVDSVVTSGPGLAFIAYPEAVTKMPISPLWSILFFSMLITLALDSEFAFVETLISAVHDQWPKYRRYNSHIVIITCAGCFLFSLPLCTRGGVYVFVLMDWYSASWSLLFISLFELIVVAWVYGIDRFSKNVEEMIGRKPNAYWRICWKYLTPLTLIAIILFSWINFTPANFGLYIFPKWANVLGWLMSLSSVILIPIFAAYQIWKIYKKGQNPLCAFRPTKKWGPAVFTLAQTSSSMESSINESRSSQKEDDDDKDSDEITAAMILRYIRNLED